MIEDPGTEGQVRRHCGTAVAANGPEDDDLDWGLVNWPRVEDEVRRLRQRIFTASQAGDLKRVRSLQKLMLRSRANALVSVCYRRNSLRTTVVFSARIFADRVDSAASLKTA